MSNGQAAEVGHVNVSWLDSSGNIISSVVMVSWAGGQPVEDLTIQPGTSATISGAPEGAGAPQGAASCQATGWSS